MYLVHSFVRLYVFMSVSKNFSVPHIFFPKEKDGDRRKGGDKKKVWMEKKGGDGKKRVVTEKGWVWKK